MASRLTSVAEIEHELCRLRALEEEGPVLRTSVMTHSAWVPPEWLSAAESTLAGLAERHPSRTVVLVPEPDAEENGLEAEVELERFPTGEQSICSEVLHVRLLGDRARVPASVLVPLLVADLPVFLRWRGRPAFGEPELEQLTDVVDRVIIDSGEWDDLPEAYGPLTAYFERAAWSDIAWARTLPWRRALAALWPRIAELRRLTVVGPAAEGSLLAGWLCSRLGRELAVEREHAGSVERIAVDGEEVPRPAPDSRSPSDLLSDELERFGREHVYEQAVTRAAAAA